MTNIVLSALLIVLVQLGTGCSLAPGLFDDTATVSVSLPSPQPVYALVNPSARPSYTARWYAADGTPRERSGITGPFTLELDKTCLTPIILCCESEPIGIPPECLPVAGALYPVHAEDSGSGMKLKTSWKTGIDAELVERLCASAAGGFSTGRTLAAHFNWPRFDREIETIGDPLTLNRLRFLEALLAGDFTVYDVCARELFTITLPERIEGLEGTTQLLSAWPGGTTLAWQPPLPSSLELPDGLSRFFGPDGYLTIEIVDGKRRCVFFTRYALQD